MILLEYEAKLLLQQSGVAVPVSQTVTSTADTPPLPTVLKSQVPVGGRGKAGGIKIVDAQEDLHKTIEELLKLPINGHLPKIVLAEEKLAIKKELYLSLRVDRETMTIQLMAHIDGGVEVEDQTGFKTWTINNNTDEVAPELADYYELYDQTKQITELINNLLSCLQLNDATLIEINPLVLTEQTTLVAADCKMTLDDAAGFRHNWQFEEKPAESNFVTINPEGTVATIANGAGLAMATVDAVFEAGLTPANFLDIGGGANEHSLVAVFGRITEYKNIKAIVINIFAGITRADEVAKAIVAAEERIEKLPPLYIRLAGTNYEAAVKILTKNEIAILPSLEACLTAAKEAINE